jgi:hypothetical protein
MTQTPGVSAQKADEQPKWVALTRAAFERVTQQFIKNTKVELGALGPLAKVAADEIYKMLEAGAKADGTVKSELVLAAYQQLKQAHSRDQASGFDLGDPPSVTAAVHGQIPSDKRERWAKDNGKGGFELIGLIGSDHLVYQLVKKVGLDPKNLSEDVIKKLEDRGHSATWGNLTDGAAWKDLGKQLREMALDLGVTGGPTTADVRRAMANASAQLPASHEPSRQQQDLGLKKTATGTSNTGSTSNATAIRAQLLTGLKANGNVDQVATGLADQLLKDLKVTDVSSGLKGELVSAL